MYRREMFGLLGATAAGLTGLAGHSIALADDKQEDDGSSAGGPHERCLRSCTECAVACNKTTRHCLDLIAQGRKDHSNALGMMLDSEELCSVAMKLVARSSPHMTRLCEVCAKACDDCATECGKFSSDPQMAACAKVCRECSADCRAMVMAEGGHH